MPSTPSSPAVASVDTPLNALNYYKEDYRRMDALNMKLGRATAFLYWKDRGTMALLGLTLYPLILTFLFIPWCWPLIYDPSRPTMMLWLIGVMLVHCCHLLTLALFGVALHFFAWKLANGVFRDLYQVMNDTRREILGERPEEVTVDGYVRLMELNFPKIDRVAPWIAPVCTAKRVQDAYVRYTVPVHVILLFLESLVPSIVFFVMSDAWTMRDSVFNLSLYLLWMAIVSVGCVGVILLLNLAKCQDKDLQDPSDMPRRPDILTHRFPRLQHPPIDSISQPELQNFPPPPPPPPSRSAEPLLMHENRYDGPRSCIASILARSMLRQPPQETTTHTLVPTLTASTSPQTPKSTPSTSTSTCVDSDPPVPEVVIVDLDSRPASPASSKPCSLLSDRSDYRTPLSHYSVEDHPMLTVSACTSVHSRGNSGELIDEIVATASSIPESTSIINVIDKKQKSRAMVEQKTNFDDPSDPDFIMSLDQYELLVNGSIKQQLDDKGVMDAFQESDEKVGTLSILYDAPSTSAAMVSTSAAVAPTSTAVPSLTWAQDLPTRKSFGKARHSSLKIPLGHIVL
ncbi:hypothetical protein BC940DRAFT_337056 [Gongronella butleri]|nr:hypothetical protein BC940DRAFT_337056 [Gongronella butleri]